MEKNSVGRTKTENGEVLVERGEYVCAHTEKWMRKETGRKGKGKRMKYWIVAESINQTCTYTILKNLRKHEENNQVKNSRTFSWLIKNEVVLCCSQSLIIDPINNWKHLCALVWR